jgi:hypothetical protein
MEEMFLKIYTQDHQHILIKIQVRKTASKIRLPLPLCLQLPHAWPSAFFAEDRIG